MPIQFKCPSCDRLIQAPDEAAGRSIRCPLCGGISEAPSSQESSSEGSSAAWPPPQPAGHSDRDDLNPFASPSLYAEDTQRPPGVHFSDVLSTTWRIFSDNIAACLLMSLVLIGVILAIVAVFVGFFMVLGAMAAAVGGAGGGQGGGVAALGIGFILVFIVLFVVVVIAGFWVQAAVANVTLRLARGAPNAGVGDMFTVWPFLLRIIGYRLIVTLVAMVGFAVLTIPVLVLQNPGVMLLSQYGTNLIQYVLFLVYGLGPFLILDKNQGVFESMRMSAKYMSGNFLQAFFLHVVTYFGMIAFTLVTCGIGGLVAFPFFFLTLAVIYCKAAGVPTAGELRPAQP